MAPASKFGGRWNILFWGEGGGNVKNAPEARKSLPYYAKVVKFGLILTHLKLFWGKLGDTKIFFGGMLPYHPVAQPLIPNLNDSFQ